mmetsp:Transcript_20647/g.65048  ORF Transcript_20647/g.65048 Transcript_20647/m.65048 type:complete len:82 (-) Transcript_20647:2892-3137(-)
MLIEAMLLLAPLGLDDAVLCAVGRLLPAPFTLDAAGTSPVLWNSLVMSGKTLALGAAPLEASAHDHQDATPALGTAGGDFS